MDSRQRLLAAFLVASGLLGELRGTAAGADAPAAADPTEAADLARTASWSQPTAAAITERLNEWLAAVAGSDPAKQDAARAIWGDAAGDRLDRLMRAVAVIDEPAAKLLAGIDRLSPAAISELADAFAAEPAADFGGEVVPLWTARQLVRSRRYDEAAPLLIRLAVASSPDPATLLFCRAACESWLLQAEAAGETIARLLEREAEIPVRYAQVARLLEADTAALEPESLDHISRRMRDITRRLDLGHAGARVREPCPW